MLKLPNGEKARVISEITNDLCPYCNAEFPAGEYSGFELYINLETGIVYAHKE